MLLVCNGPVLTRDENNPFIKKGAVAVQNDRIIEVGEHDWMVKCYPDAERIDVKGNLIMPGLINAHNHIYSAFARGLSMRGYNPKSFSDILEGMWWTLDRHLTLEDTHMSAMATYLDCIRCGVTTVFDHHASYGEVGGSLFEISRAADALGVRTSLCYEISDRDGEGRCRDAINENAAFIHACSQRKDGMQKAMVGLHASFTLSDQTLEAVRERMPADTGFHIHIAEGMEDVYDSLKKYNKRVVNRLFDHGILGRKTVAGHCIHIDGNEMELLRETDTVVVHNPESNMANAVGCPPALEFIKRGILTGLGTDGYTQDMLESAKVANLLHKHHLCNPTVGFGEVSKMLFENNAKITSRFFETPIGALKAGYAADIISIDYDSPTHMDETNANGHLLFGVMGKDVSMTMINGKLKMRDKELVNIDSASILAKCRTVSTALWSRIDRREFPR